MTEIPGFGYPLRICVYFLKRPHLAPHQTQIVPEEDVCVIYHGFKLISLVVLALTKCLLGRQIKASISFPLCLEIKIEWHATK